MPKHKRELQWNSGIGEGSDAGKYNRDGTFNNIKVKAVFGKAERKFAFPPWI